MSYKFLDKINSPKDLKKFNKSDLPEICAELRQETINIVSQTGGHLGAGLGVVELTTALHYVFNTPKDVLIWDVGHQAYPHKIITGRKAKMLTIRQKDGLAGFTKRKESKYDPFGAGHSSTSISAALGFAVATAQQKQNNKTIAVIGDGAMSAGMAYEALNNASVTKHKNLIIILNDNEMSIAKPSGALSTYLAKLSSSSSYLNIKNFAKDLLGKMPNIVQNTVKAAKNHAKEIVIDSVSGNNIFEQLGINYLGPIDGHDVESLVEILGNIAQIEHEKPFLLHVVTKKGHGYDPATASADKYHGVAKFDVKTGTQKKSPSNIPTYTKIFASELIKQAKKDKNIMAITAAMPDGTGLTEYAKHYPERFFDVGIAEQHAVTFAAGLAAAGLNPVVAIYSTFLQRAYDQIVHDVAVQNLPVKFAIDRAGLVGADGPTHAGSFDLSYLCSLPNMVVMAASDDQELINMTYTALNYNAGPIAFRFPRGSATGAKLKAASKITIGKSRLITQGKEILILSLGTRLAEVRIAAENFAAKYGFSPTIIDIRFAKPIDKTAIKQQLKTQSKILTIEEGSIGGFSAQINELLNDVTQKTIVKNLFLPDEFIDQAAPDEMYQMAGLDHKNIYKHLLKLHNAKL